MEPLRHTSVLQFGTYEIALHSGELRKAGVRIKVQQQPLKLLEILLEHPGEVVTREELRSRIWPNESFGDFDQAVNVAIAKLRGALGDSADNPRYIETLPRRGYRFIAEVAVVNRPTNKLELLARSCFFPGRRACPARGRWKDATTQTSALATCLEDVGHGNGPGAISFDGLDIFLEKPPASQYFVFQPRSFFSSTSS